MTIPPTPVVHRHSTSSCRSLRSQTSLDARFDHPTLGKTRRSPSVAHSREFASFRHPNASHNLEDEPSPDYMRVFQPSDDNASDEGGYMRSPSGPLRVRSQPSSRWHTLLPSAPLEAIEEDASEDHPPLSSSPARSSDPFFPTDALDYSPQTSEPDETDILTKRTLRDRSRPMDQDQLSELNLRLMQLPTGRVISYPPIIDDRSYPPTPEYRPAGSPTPNSFGHQEQAPLSPTVFVNRLCMCEQCVGASPLEMSSPSATGYEADSEDMLVQSSNCATPTQFLLQTSIPRLGSAKRNFSSLDKHSSSFSSNKKLKLSSSRPLNRSFDSAHLIKAPASLRKSLSLQSSTYSAELDELVPTRPNTPDLPLPAFRVPIIAPPADYFARLPVTAEVAAKTRIVNLIAREERLRRLDKLDVAGSAVDSDSVEREKVEWEAALGIGAARKSVIKWFLDVAYTREMYDEVFPGPSARGALSRESSFASISTQQDEDDVPDLTDQLNTSPETRFHAAHLFLRYFRILMANEKERARIEALQSDELQEVPVADMDSEDITTQLSEGWRWMLWDAAVACLAISVKMFRDFLDPLYPVLSCEYEYLAPHSITFEELETAQKDVLSGLNYRLGSSPQLLLDELWQALPSLRELLNFDGAWNYAQKETWSKLFNALLEPDVLKFPISHLTAVALIEGLYSTLVTKKEFDMPLRGRRRNAADLAKLHARAKRQAWHVADDVQAAVGLSDANRRVVTSWVVRYC
uniref:Uncharacterized protein n=1 Tax=Mycena chlorophos TaxID=658473 RepID=A0ABQ0LTI8_MYCCL|nr:predicted protein [Mycena chlorophos]